MNSPQQNIFLVGPMGSGKTSVGKLLARRIKRRFLDSDQEIERRTGVDVRLIFEIEGEQGFRLRETRVIDALTREQGIVLATGGGAVLAQANRDVLSQRGTVVYLHTSPQQSVARTRRDGKRPLLDTEDPEQRLMTLLQQRDPLYREIADLIVHTDGRTVTSVVAEIRRRLSPQACSTRKRAST